MGEMETMLQESVSFSVKSVLLLTPLKKKKKFNKNYNYNVTMQVKWWYGQLIPKSLSKKLSKTRFGV